MMACSRTEALTEHSSPRGYASSERWNGHLARPSENADYVREPLGTETLHNVDHCVRILGHVFLHPADRALAVITRLVAQRWVEILSKVLHDLHSQHARAICWMKPQPNPAEQARLAVPTCCRRQVEMFSQYAVMRKRLSRCTSVVADVARFERRISSACLWCICTSFTCRSHRAAFS